MIIRKGGVCVRQCIVLAALVAAIPATVLAQWWGPAGGPVGLGGIPRPPSVGEFMSNPHAAAPIPSRVMREVRTQGEGTTISPSAYVMRPRVVLPSAGIVSSTAVVPATPVIRPVTVMPAATTVVRPVTVMPAARVIQPMTVVPAAQVIRPSIVVTPSGSE